MKDRQTVYFKAHWGLSLQLSTLGWFGLMGGLGAFAFNKLAREHAVGLFAILVLYTLWCLLTYVRGYRIRGCTIEVIRPIWTTRIDATLLRKIRLDPNAMQGSMPIFANVGLFSFSGWFQAERHGMFRAFVTDRSCIVRLRIGKDTPLLMFSPDDPENFLRVLRDNTRKP